MGIGLDKENLRSNGKIGGLKGHFIYINEPTPTRS
jgi:hypothetical protein